MEPDNNRRLSKIELAFVAGLLVSNVIANYQFKALITLLTDEWGVKLFYAVILTNVQEGMKALLLILVAALSDTCLGDCLTLFLSAIVYASGMLIWYFTLRSLGYDTSPGVVFYLALVLITAGQCGCDKYVAKYTWYQKEGEHKHIHERVINYDEDQQVISERENKALTSKDERKRSRLLFYIRKVFTRIWVEIKCHWIIIMGLPIAIFAIPMDGSESLILAIILLSTAALFFIGKMCLYPFKRPQKSSLVEVFRVLLVALMKWRYDTHGTCRYYGDAESATEDKLTSQVSELQNGDTVDENMENFELENDIYIDLEDDMEDNFEQEGVNHVDLEVITEESFALESNNHIDFPICIKESSESENNNHANPEDIYDQEVNIEGSSELENNHEVNIEDSDELDNDSHVDHKANTESHVDHEANTEDSEPELAGDEEKLGFLNKAALYNPLTENPSTEFQNHRLCTVKQVDDAKHFFNAIRLSAVFLMYGLLTAVGDTFFLDQANNMETSINSIQVPVQLIAYSPNVIRYLISTLCGWVAAKQDKAKHNPFNGAVRVGLGMLLAIPCFVTAFLVERKSKILEPRQSSICVLAHTTTLSNRSYERISGRWH